MLGRRQSHINGDSSVTLISTDLELAVLLEDLLPRLVLGLHHALPVDEDRHEAPGEEEQEQVIRVLVGQGVLDDGEHQDADGCP